MLTYQTIRFLSCLIGNLSFASQTANSFFFALNFFSCEMEYGVNQIEIGKSNLLTKRVECVHITTAVKSDRALLFYDFSCLGIELRYFYAVEKRYKMKSGTNCYFTECFVL